MSQAPRFIHLRTHTEHSLLEGAVPVKKLVKLVAGAGMPAVAVTDTNNMFAALEFSVTAKDAGVQPIVGCQVSVAHDPAGPGEKLRLPAPLVLLSQNEAGYLNLMKLNSCLYIDKGGQLNQVLVEELERYSEGLICLTGGADGPVGRFLQAGQAAKAQAFMERLAAIFGDRLYVELQRHPGEGGRLTEAEAATERGFVEMAYEMGLPLVATNDVYFPKTEMYEAHDALICIAEGAYVDQQQPRRLRRRREAAGPLGDDGLAVRVCLREQLGLRRLRQQVGQDWLGVRERGEQGGGVAPHPERHGGVRQRREQRRVGPQPTHGEAEIIGHEIGKAQPHADHSADQQLARTGKAECRNRAQQRHQHGR